MQGVFDSMVVDRSSSFRFRRAMVFRRESTDQGIILTNDGLDLVAYGRTLDEALDDLDVELWFVWREMVMCDGSQLDQVALEYRSWLLDAVEGPMGCTCRIGDVRTGQFR